MSTATVCKRQTGPNTAEIERETVRRQILRDLADGRFFVFLFGRIRRIIEKTRGVLRRKEDRWTASGEDNIHCGGWNI